MMIERWRRQEELGNGLIYETIVLFRVAGRLVSMPKRTAETILQQAGYVRDET